MKSFMIGRPHTDYSGNQLKNKERGVACGTFRDEDRCIRDFGGET
jgi:hypothetical protein